MSIRVLVSGSGKMGHVILSDLTPQTCPHVPEELAERSRTGNNNAMRYADPTGQASGKGVVTIVTARRPLGRSNGMTTASRVPLTRDIFERISSLERDDR